MSTMTGALLLMISGAVLLVLTSARVRHNRVWMATATPLASIIGSGFLIVAPLLGGTVGAWAPVAMAAICTLALGVGAVLRYQIRVQEPRLAAGTAPAGEVAIEQLSGLALALAYVVSVAFYLRLLSAFVLSSVVLDDHATGERILSTLLMGFIAGWGVTRGLGALESLEDAAVSVKLAIIAAMVSALFVFDASGMAHRTLPLPSFDVDDPIRAVRTLAGLLLVVQGFETSRYLGEAYDAPLRIRTMWWAQVFTGVLYVAFVALCLPLLTQLSGPVDDTAIITLSGRVHALLPMMLIVAAVMSQFSAAIADTLGGGGLASELTGARLSPRAGYVLLICLAVVLTWTADIFQVISIASRAFALYYALQTVSATRIAWSRGEQGRVVAFSALAVVLLAVVLFAMPAE